MESDYMEIGFIPLSEQVGPGRSQFIVLDVEFPELPPLESVACAVCQSPVERVAEKYQFGWGHKERDGLVVGVPNVPQLKCGCGFSIEGIVLTYIQERARVLLMAIESEDPDGIAGLSELLCVDDVRRVHDFTFNRARYPFTTQQ